MNTELEKVSQIIENNFGCCAEDIKKIENVTNNSVYSFSAAGERYFIKLYRSKDWPEEGKVPFVNRLLMQNNIPCAELVAFDREQDYLIEREVPGVAADKIRLDKEQEVNFFIRLSELVSSVHSIKIKNFGYIGSGIACYDSMISFFEDEFDRLDDELKNVISITQFERLKEKFFDTMRDFEDLPSVLCHGDLSKKNVIMQDNGEISLIDWDDAMAFNWMADISRLTFWIKLNYNEQDSALFRNTFLEHYSTSYRKSEFDTFENAFHIYSALDSLIFFISIGDKEMENRLMGYLDSVDLR